MEHVLTYFDVNITSTGELSLMLLCLSLVPFWVPIKSSWLLHLTAPTTCVHLPLPLSRLRAHGRQELCLICHRIL